MNKEAFFFKTLIDDDDPILIREKENNLGFKFFKGTSRTRIRHLYVSE